MQVQPEELTKNYLKQIQEVVNVGLELRISRFQVGHAYHLAMLPLYEFDTKFSYFTAPTRLHHSFVRTKLFILTSKLWKT